MKTRNKFLDPDLCDQCGPLPINHTQNYIDTFITLSVISKLPVIPFGQVVVEKMFIKTLELLGLVHYTAQYEYSQVSLRTTVFIDEAVKRGFSFEVLKGPYGYLNQFRMRVGSKSMIFEGLPFSAPESRRSAIVDDKIEVKKILRDAGVRVAEGKAFWAFKPFYSSMKEKAVTYGLGLGFPLIVKPRNGSMSQHITANITDEAGLRRAIDTALIYSPAFIVERYLADMQVYRATVVGKEKVFIVERIPAHVVGDGTHNIEVLVKEKNLDPARGKPKAKDTTLYRIVIDHTTERLLKEKGLTMYSIPKKNEVVFLQEKVILDLGADLYEVTETAHPDNIELFQKVATIFQSDILGIDFLASDITKSWKHQSCAVIELNSLPYIDMHHFPTYGKPQNISKAIVELVVRRLA
jgi:cyanophycin synthetase